MPFKKLYRVHDRKTGRKVWSNGRGEYSLSNKGQCTLPAEFGQDLPEDRLAFFLAKIEKKLGRPCELRDGRTVEYFDVTF